MDCKQFKYPQARRDSDVCDDYHGTKVSINVIVGSETDP